MKKRDFIKISLLSAAGCITLPSSAKSQRGKAKPAFEALPFSFENGHINKLFSAKEIAVHHQNNYAAPASALSNMNLHGKKSKKIFKRPHLYNEHTMQLVGEFFNHRIFFKSISSGSVEITPELSQQIRKSFGTIGNLKKELAFQVSKSMQEGWLWLIHNGNTLTIVSTKNNDNPLMANLPQHQQGFPLIAIDLWSHAIDNSQAVSKEEYFSEFWNALNWSYISERFAKAEKHFIS